MTADGFCIPLVYCPYLFFYALLSQQRTPTPWHSWRKCLKRPFRSFYPKVQHKYSQKHYHKILICKYLKTCSWSTTWRKHEESRVICCIIVHYSTVVPHNFSYIYPWKLKKVLEFHIWKRVGTLWLTIRKQKYFRVIPILP
jgi:hypothetical protein